MSKESNIPGGLQPDTSYNKYSAAKSHHSDTNIRADKNIKKKLEDYIQSHYNHVIMGGVVFTTEEVGEMLNKAVVTINKEARGIGAGMVKGVGRFYTKDDVIAIHNSFALKRKPQKRKRDSLKESISWTIFQEFTAFTERYDGDFQKMYVLVGNIFDNLKRENEELKQTIKTLSKRVKNIEEG